MHAREIGDPFLGRVIAKRYLVSKLIGEGSSGKVYRAESLTIPRRFAIKFISTQGNGPEAEAIRERIRRETEAVLRLRNPHVINLYDVIDLGHQTVAIVMEYIDGETLEGLVHENQRLSLRRALRIARQVANGLFEAHHHGLIHRDIKPENIMVERMPAGDDFVHILDFGIVWASGKSHVTQGFIGTPLFASPDQAMGLEIDQRSDIYSLGATLFFMLAGRPPFKNGSVMKILHDHVKEAPPDLRNLCEGEPGIEELATLVEMMLAKSPADRPQDMKAVIAEFDRIEREVFQSGPIERPQRMVPQNETSSCGQCGVSAKGKASGRPRVVPQSGRSDHDVPCMTEIQTTGAIENLVLSRTHFAFSSDDSIYWGSFLTHEVFDCAIQVADVSCLALSDRGILVGCRSGKLMRIRETDAEPELVHEAPGPILALAADPRGHLIVMQADHQIWVREMSKWHALEEASDATSCAVSPTSSQFAVGYEDGTMRVWQTATRESSKSIRVGEKRVDRIAFSADDYLVAGLCGGQISLEAPMAEKRIFGLGDFAADVHDLVFSKSGNLMAIAEKEERLFVLDLQCEHAATCTPESSSCHRLE